MFEAQYHYLDWILHVVPVLSDNYAYVWEGPDSCAIIDPGEAGPLLKKVKETGKPCNQVIVTHDHFDHIGGLNDCLAATPAQVWAAEGIPGHSLHEGQGVVLSGCPFTAMETPGHIQQHIALYSPQAEVVFAADALFVGGCGRVFTGDTTLMWSSLEKLKQLPAETRVFCGHEYTLSNLRFAERVFPDYKELAEYRKKMQSLLNEGKPTVPTTIGQERLTNMFFRCDEPGVKQALGLPGAAPEKVFAALRKLKDQG